jgi:hypothetical protein
VTGRPSGAFVSRCQRARGLIPLPCHEFWGAVFPFICLHSFLLCRFFLSFPTPDEGRAERRQAPGCSRASGCVHDRTRALTFEARARRRSDPTPRLSALRRDVFWTRPSALFSFFPGPGSNGCSWGRGSRDAGRCPPTCGGKPRRGRHTLLGLSGSPLEGSPHEQG